MLTLPARGSLCSGFVFQTFNLLSSMTALENVEMPMILAGELSATDRRSRAMELLNSVGMGSRLNHHPSQLSGGEQQRVTIARSMANEPEILLLDEPTGDLDTLNTAIVMKLLTDLNKNKKITLIMVTHDVGLKNFADRIVWMRDGKIVRVETVHPKMKMERFDELDAEIVALSSGHKRMAKVNDPGQNTVLRQPQDYATHPEHAKREAELYNFSSPRAFALTQDEFERQTGLRPAQDILPPPRSINVRAPTSSIPSEDVLVDVAPASVQLSDSGSLDPAGASGPDFLV
jgi:ABC-type nitrate/sulfonate/bicarbonate transport system ATPase subunit